MKIAVVFGGRSDEHEVSRNSVANVLKSLSDKYEVIKIGITREGCWYLTDAGIEDIKSGAWEENAGNKYVCLASDPAVHGLYVFEKFGEAGLVDKVSLDCIIPVLHGDFGEDGTIQGAFEMSGIPYVGPNVKASANCMDKTVTKRLAAETGVTMAECCVISRHDYRNAAGREAAVKQATALLEKHEGVFVKPSSAGSSVGVTRVTEASEVAGAIDKAFEFDNKVLIEEMIVGREVEVAVLGNYEPEASRVGEILADGEFYDYDAKYNNPQSKTWIPDDLPDGVSDEIREYAIKVYRALECTGLSRVDFFYSDSKGVVFNEINTLPGFTDISMYPILWQDMGVSGEELMDRLIALAIECAKEK